MNERNREGSQEDREEIERGKAREYASTVAGDMPARYEFVSEGEYDEAMDVYWDNYYRAYDEYISAPIKDYYDDIADEQESLSAFDNTSKDLEAGDGDADWQELEEFWGALDSMYERGGNKIQKEDRSRSRRFFRDPEARYEVFAFSKSIAEYMKDNEIKDLVIADRSSRPLYIGVREYWKAKFKNYKMPGIYFINPKGFKNRDTMDDDDLRMANNDAMFKDDLYESLDTVRSEAEILQELQAVYPQLMHDKHEGVLLFDTCIHSGDTLSSVVGTFKKLGFDNLKVGSVNPADGNSTVKTDFYITRTRPEGGCYPFDRDRMIEKTFEHVYSKPARSKEKRALGIELREEIKAIMHEHME